MPLPSPSRGEFLEFRPPDVVHMRASESPVDLEQLAERLRGFAAQARFYLVIDFTGMTGSIDTEMREKGPKLIKPEWMLGIAYINASMPVRLALKVINLAMFLAGKSDFPTEFVNSEAEAMAAVERFRADQAARARR